MTRIRSLLAALIALALALALAGCASDSDADPGGSGSSDSASETITVEHAQGSTELQTNPEKIVVLDLAVLDNVDTLGAGDSIVGLTKSGVPESLSTYADNEDIADVGTMQEPDMEKIAEIDPDVILIGGRSAAKYAELAEIAPTVDLTVASTDYLESFTTNVETLAAILGKESEAQDALADVDAAIADAKTAVTGKGTGLIVLVSGGKLSAFGLGSRFGMVHDVLGLEPASTDLSTDRHGQPISHEFIAQTNPDWLLVIDRDAAIGQPGQSAQEVLTNPLVDQTTAATNDQIIYLDGALWYVQGSGLTAIPEMLKPITEQMGS